MLEAFLMKGVSGESDGLQDQALEYRVTARRLG